MGSDPRFYHKNTSVTLEVLARITGSELNDKNSANFLIEGVNIISRAGTTEITFVDNVKYLPFLQTTKAGACILHPKYLPNIPENLICLLSEEPYETYAKVAQYFYPSSTLQPYISPTAIIDPSAIIDPECYIADYVVIEPDVTVGQKTYIGPHSHIQTGSIIGRYCRIESQVTISYSIIEDYVSIHSGARIGQTGFGFHMSKKGMTLVPQLGRVIVGKNVRIGANTTVDRGSIDDTIIGQGTMIDNLVQIGHNVQIGQYCVIVAQTGIAGSAILEDYCVIGGQVGIAGHLKLGQGTQIAAQSGIMRDTTPGSKWGGSPALPVREWHKLTILQQRQLRSYQSRED